jgi:hypothetical protein
MTTKVFVSTLLCRDPQDSLIFAFLLKNRPANADQNKKKNLYLCSLPVGCTDISLKDRIGQG